MLHVLRVGPGGVVQVVGRPFDGHRDILQHLPHHGNLRLRFVPFLLIHVFADSGDR